LTEPGGAENVLKQMLLVFPDADLFTVCDFLPEEHRGFLKGRRPQTTFIQHLPRAKEKYRSYLALMPLAIEQFDLSAYDLILSSSYCVAKGVLTGPTQTHVSYVHSPVRYAWHLQHQYLAQVGAAKGMKSWIARAILHYIRMWDLRSSVCIDAFIGNSGYIAQQVRKLYRQPCSVLYPPVDLGRFPLTHEKAGYYVTASRLVPYKRIDLIVSAFAAMPERELVVIGHGPEADRIKAAAQGKANIRLLGYVSDEVLQHHVSKAKAFVFASVEDFGIAPLEAQACGTPVIALGKGGALETIRPLSAAEPTGVLFAEQTVEAIMSAVMEFERHGDRISPAACRQNAERFAPEMFRENLMEMVEAAFARVKDEPFDTARVRAFEDETLYSEADVEEEVGRYL
jgi:glycosyltransferase involved in cell wall biosynthesis